MSVQSEFSDLVPLFVEESRDRLERVASLLPRLEREPRAVAEARRELHTMKGAGRMLRLAGFASLCHAAEEVLYAPGAGMAALLTRATDRLAEMLEAVARGEEPAGDADLLADLDSWAGARGAAPAPAAPAASAGPATPARAATPKISVRRRERAIPPEPASGGELRVEAATVDALAERATLMRIMARGAARFVGRADELARLADAGLGEREPRQVLAVLAAMLRRLAVEAEGAQRRLGRAAEEQLELLLAVQLQPLRGAMLSLARYARDLARTLGREVEVETAGEETRLDRRIARELEEALLHLVRNAVDHGIEPQAVRAARGKPRAGRVRLAAESEAGRVRLSIADDGAGIDPSAVVDRAVESGLLEASAAAAMATGDVMRLLFAAGFSTRENVSEISGRGVGLDVVAAVVRRVGGEVVIESTPGEGTEITIEVPVVRRGELVILVRVGHLRLALPAAAIKRAVRLWPGALAERDGGSVAAFEDRLVPYVPLAEIYGQAGADRPLLLEGAAAGAPLAVVVDAVEGEEEVLVRPLPHAVGVDRLLDGVALLASGEPVGVLSPAMLVEREATRARPAPRARAAVKPRVLLVDDSQVTREMERRLLEDAGFEVTAAGDAEEALQRLDEQGAQCLVVDVEMPGMDGFELTERLRASERFAQLPVVVVSTRSRPEDRLRGLEAGADAYLSKQNLDATELVDLLQRLVGR